MGLILVCILEFWPLNCLFFKVCVCPQLSVHSLFEDFFDPVTQKLVHEFVLHVGLHTAPSVLSELSNRMEKREMWVVNSSILLGAYGNHGVHKRYCGARAAYSRWAVHYGLFIISRLQIPFDKVVQHHFEVVDCGTVWYSVIGPPNKMNLSYILYASIWLCRL